MNHVCEYLDLSTRCFANPKPRQRTLYASGRLSWAYGQPMRGKRFSRCNVNPYCMPASFMRQAAKLEMHGVFGAEFPDEKDAFFHS